MKADDRELLMRWRDGDDVAGNALFERHFDALRRFFSNKAPLRDVEDLIQRTLMSCLESVGSFRGESSFRTYLFVIARRELYDFVQRKLRSERREEPDLGVTSIEGAGITPSMAALANQQQELLARAIQGIPVELQVTLELYYWEQMTGPELAEVLGISPAGVRTRLHRARAALRERLTALASDFKGDDDVLGRSLQGLGQAM